MSLHPRIAGKVFGQPWQMLPERYAAMCAVFARLDGRTPGEKAAVDDPMGPEVEDFWTGERRPAQRQVEVMGPVALLYVYEVTGKGLSRLEMECGDFDLKRIREQLANAG
ncbi:MAG: hypothetical protein EOP84_08495 [Verrucomicrobiaceae bacterium]|nr:MAG: hypothetical protein EOP84_08495 [Verrucomicrobiaceae bacterium]